MRRGAPSANAAGTTRVAILAGDFLFARASDLLADLGPEAVRIQARTFARLVTGQIRETVGPGAGDDPVEHYLKVIADKTGSLIATSARFGALVRRRRRAPGRGADRVRRAIGVAFQLSDDLLDIASASRRSRARRPAPTCARACRRCPCCYALAGDDPADAAAARARRRADQPTTACTPRRWGCCARPRRWSGPRGAGRVRRPGPGALADVPPGRSATRCRRCATSWSPAPADAGDAGRVRRHLTCLVTGLVLLAGCTAARPATAAPRDADSSAPPTTSAPSTAPALDVRSSPTGWTTPGRRPGPPTAPCCSTSARAASPRCSPTAGAAGRGRLRRPVRHGGDRSMGLAWIPASSDPARSTAARARRTGGRHDRGDRVDRRRGLAQRPPGSHDPLIGDIPVNERTGRHGGCRLRFGPTGAAGGTGDNAVAATRRTATPGRQGAARPDAGQPGRRRRTGRRAPQRPGAGRAARYRPGLRRRARDPGATTR